MDVLIIALASVLLYLSASLLQGIGLTGRVRRPKAWVLLFGFVAICLHGLLLYQWIDTHAGQNLTFFNMFSLTAWLVSILIMVMTLVRRLEVLVLLVFPVTALSIVLVILFPGMAVVNTAAHPDTLFHILLGIVTFCVLSVAGLLAVLLAIQERFLRYRQGGFLAQRLPSLEGMETLLFQLISFGFVLLSVVLVSSFYFYDAILWQHQILMQKAFLTVFAWVVFAVLLVGRYRFGWRGKRAIYVTLFGVLLLFCAYFGSKLVLQALGQ